MNHLAIAEMLGGYMAGVTVSGVLWAIFQNNAGGAWDNAKKSFEAGVLINGEMTFKGSDAHKAAVTGDTVGDPFKDTSGPSMNILIKLTCLIGLVIAPILGGHTATVDGVEKEMETEMNIFEERVIEGGEDLNNKTETTVEMLKNDANDNVTANVKIKKTVNGVTTSETKTFTGTDEEVRAQLENVDDLKVKMKDKE
jgi:K(+)-stimulated pyrophosphate-energized sodium pump